MSEWFALCLTIKVVAISIIQNEHLQKMFSSKFEQGNTETAMLKLTDRPHHTQPTLADCPRCTEQFDQKSTLCICQIISLKNLIVVQQVVLVSQVQESSDKLTFGMT